MAAYRSRSQHAGNGSGSLTSTITLAKPAGTVDGDFLVAILVLGFGTTALAVNSVPSGWTQRYLSGPIANGAGGYGYFVVYTKVASGEPASWAWGLNNSVAFYNCLAVANSGVNVSNPFEQLSSTQTASAASGATISRTADTTAIQETLLSILMADSAAGIPAFTESAGTEQFESGFGGCDIAYNMVDLASPSHQTVTGTVTVPAGGTAALAMVQLALLPASVDATVVAPAAAATAARAVPSAGPGIGAVPARATASRPTPPAITGNQTMIVVPGIATASRVAPSPSSSRIQIELPPDIGGEIELVEDP